MGYIDIHSHILPYLDDGAKNMDVSLKMLRIAWQEGITHIIATPHYKAGRYPADAERLRNSLVKVQQAAKEQGIPIFLYAGNEVYYRSELENKFRSGKLCTINQTEYVLIEFSPFDSFVYIRNAVEDILGMGYVPIIAHVERYQCMCKDKTCVTEIKAMGCEIQVNAGSIVGEAGWRIRRFTHKLLKEGLVDYIGTDAHNTDGRKPAIKKCAAYLYKTCKRSYADAILFTNAEKRLLGQRKSSELDNRSLQTGKKRETGDLRCGIRTQKM